VDPLPARVRDKKKKREVLARRAQEEFEAWLAGIEAPT
jgi:folate-dependent tRNA-U54 methylase TrmFO/GidA